MLDSVALVTIGAACITTLGVLVFQFFKRGTVAAGVIATVVYLLAAIAFFYVDVVLYKLEWAIPIYIVCFLICPISVYYVVSRINRLSFGSKKQTSKKQSAGQRAQQAKAAPAPTRKPSQKAQLDASRVNPKAEVQKNAQRSKKKSKPGINEELMKQKTAVTADAGKPVGNEDGFQRVGVDFAEKVMNEAKSAQKVQEAAAAKRAVERPVQRDAKPAQSATPQTMRPASRVEVAEKEAATTQVTMPQVTQSLPRIEVAEQAVERKPVVQAATSQPISAVPRAEVAEPSVTHVPEQKPVVQTIAPQPIEVAPKAEVVDTPKASEVAQKDASQEYQTYFGKAQALREKGNEKVAALLFANSAKLAVSAELQKKALFEEIVSYAKSGEAATAIEKIDAISSRADLTSSEITKLKALLLLVGK